MSLPKITSVFLNLTNACNLACRYCFVQHNPERMELQTAKDAADFLADNAKECGQTPSINFFGGEPMLMWDSIIVPLTEYIRGKYGDGYALSMTSNCTLIDRDRAEFMRRNYIGLLFSMDGDRESQERNRPMRNGESSFDVLMEKIPVILEYFPDVMFRSTVTQDTAHNLYRDICFAEQLGFQEFFTIPNCFEDWHDTSILKTEMRSYSDHYIHTFLSGKKPIIFSQLEKYFKKILLYNSAVRKEESRTSSMCKACGKCGLGSTRYAGININGDITACQEFFSRCDGYFTIGNIYTGVLDERRVELSEQYDAEPVVGDHCDTCTLNRICDGGCVANNYILSGNIHAMPHICCEWNRILFEEAVYIMTQLGNASCELFLERWRRAVG